jgi:phage shock protein A
VEERRYAEEELKRKGLLEEAKLVATSSNLEEELKIERDWRQNLEKTVENEKDKVADTNAEMEQLRKVHKAHSILCPLVQILQKFCNAVN